MLGYDTSSHGTWDETNRIFKTTISTNGTISYKQGIPFNRRDRIKLSYWVVGPMGMPSAYSAGKCAPCVKRTGCIWTEPVKRESPWRLSGASIAVETTITPAAVTTSCVLNVARLSRTLWSALRPVRMDMKAIARIALPTVSEERNSSR